MECELEVELPPQGNLSEKIDADATCAPAFFTATGHMSRSPRMELAADRRRYSQSAHRPYPPGDWDGAFIQPERAPG